MSSRNMCLLPRATLHSDSEQYVSIPEMKVYSRQRSACWAEECKFASLFLLHRNANLDSKAAIALFVL